MVIRQRLNTAHGILHSICNVGLRGRLEAEPEYQQMPKTKRHCAMKLWELVKKSCNGSACAVVDDVIGNLIEAMRNALLVRGDDFSSLPKCLEALEHRHKILTQTGFDVASEKLRDNFMSELENRRQEESKLHLKLKGWKDVLVDGSMADEIDAGKRALKDAVRARMRIRRSGSSYDQFRRDFNNGYVSRSCEQPLDVIEANRQMEHFRLLMNNRKRPKETGGSQHFLEDSPKYSCFRCNRAKPNCSGLRIAHFRPKLMVPLRILWKW